MAKGRRAQQRSFAARDFVMGALVLAAIVGAVLFLTTRGGGGDVDMRDVHGLAVSPEDPSILYVATHHGLLRGNADGWTRVGTAADDYMGFTMHPTNASIVYVSGHPATGGSMGVRVSTDGGETWRQTSLQNVDLHAMTISPADPQRLWGIAQGRVHLTTDGGATWTVTSTQAPNVASVRGDPTDARSLYAATGAGILRSTDDGATWRPLATIPALGLAITPDGRTLYAGGVNALWTSTDAGATWTPLATPGEGRFMHLGLDPTSPTTLYVATPDATIHRSSDAGATWTTIRS